MSITSYQIRSVAQSCPTLCDPMNRSTPGLLSITNSQSSLRLTSIKWMMPSSHLILCHPLLLMLSIYPSIRVFSNESVLCLRGSKCWNFSFSISLCNEYLGMISFRKRKAMTNLGSVLKSRDITLPTKVCIIHAMVFLVVMYGCESWTIKKTER